MPKIAYFSEVNCFNVSLLSLVHKKKSPKGRKVEMPMEDYIHRMQR